MRDAVVDPRENRVMTLSRQIVEVGLQLVKMDLTDGTSGNISARCPDGMTALITPSALDYRLVTERDLVRLDLGSGNAEGRRKPSSEWRLHVAIYRARSDINAVIHHHATWASAVAVARRTIPVLIDEAADIGPIPTAPYAPSASEALAETAAGEFERGSNAILLANHGAVVVGRDLREATRRALEVERLAKIYIGAELLGGAQALDRDQVARSRKFFETYRALKTEPRPGREVGAGVTFASFLRSLILQFRGGTLS
ncbi:MAG TPA: class II aldolase/adducin family protein [Candidatus Methylomirabilis sp.]